MALTVEEMEFFSIFLSVKHAILSKVVGWTFPIEDIAKQTIRILFGG